MLASATQSRKIFRLSPKYSLFFQSIARENTTTVATLRGHVGNISEKAPPALTVSRLRVLLTQRHAATVSDFWGASGAWEGRRKLGGTAGTRVGAWPAWLHRASITNSGNLSS